MRTPESKTVEVRHPIKLAHYTPVKFTLIESRAEFKIDWMRFVVVRNLFLMFFYYESWYTYIYRFNMPKKKFNPEVCASRSLPT
jgi:hypothetical protein